MMMTPGDPVTSISIPRPPSAPLAGQERRRDWEAGRAVSLPPGRDGEEPPSPGAGRDAAQRNGHRRPRRLRWQPERECSDVVREPGPQTRHGRSDPRSARHQGPRSVVRGRGKRGPRQRASQRCPGTRSAPIGSSRFFRSARELGPEYDDATGAARDPSLSRCAWRPTRTTVRRA